MPSEYDLWKTEFMAMLGRKPKAPPRAPKQEAAPVEAAPKGRSINPFKNLADGLDAAMQGKVAPPKPPAEKPKPKGSWYSRR
jgi:hypothetical protein